MEDCKFEELPDNIVKLKKLQPNFSKILRSPPHPGYKELDLPEGTSYMVGLLKNKDCAVARVYSSAQSVVMSHQHDEWELILVLEGELHLLLNGSDVKILKPRQFIALEPGVGHSAYYPKESQVLCVTMPPSEFFPEG